MADCMNCTLSVDDNHPKTAVMIIVLLIGTLCILLNGLVLLSLLLKEKLRQNPYHFLVLLLSFCDVLVGVGFVIQAFRMQKANWMNSEVLCIFMVTSLTNGMILSLLQTCWISLQRYLIICKTEWSNRLFQGNRKYCVCLLSWLVILVFTMGLISPAEEKATDKHDFCGTAYVYSGNRVVFKVFAKSSLFLLVLTVVLYCITIRNVIKMNRQNLPQNRVEYSKQITSCLPNENSDSTQHTSTDSREVGMAWGRPDDNLSSMQPPSTRNVRTVEELPAARSVPAAEGYVQNQPPLTAQHAQIAALRRKKIVNTIVLVGILMLFLIFLSGPLILSFVIPDLPFVYLNIAAGLCGLNSLINPFIYCWKMPEVKDAILQYLRKVFRCL
jgi:hypothetical protein